MMFLLLGPVIFREINEPKEGFAGDRAKEFFNFLVFKALHVLVFQTLENDFGGTAHNILSLVPKCKMGTGENKFVNLARLRGSWTM